MISPENSHPGGPKNGLKPQASKLTYDQTTRWGRSTLRWDDRNRMNIGSAAKRINRFLYRIKNGIRSTVFDDIDAADVSFIESFTPYTMTSRERRYHLLNAIRYIVHNQIPGDIVECGVWKGGSMMLVAKTLLDLGVRDRELYLFDTFNGMPRPESVDVDYSGTSADERLRLESETRSSSWVWAIASLLEVTKNMRTTGYPEQRIRYVRGLVEETVPLSAPEKIALLRLDTDWYASTKHELIHLWPRLVSGGVLIIDDYGDWKGARKAVDEFVAELPEPILLHRIDGSCRSAVKL